jgi:hypothetical protein
MKPDLRQILSDPAVSDWLKGALLTALQRDPVDAAHDIEILADILGRRCDAALADDVAHGFSDPTAR